MDQLVNKNQLKEQATEKIRRIIVDVENQLTSVGRLAYDVHSLCETEGEFNEWLGGFSQFSSFVNGAYIRYCHQLTLTGNDASTAKLLDDFNDTQLRRFKKLSQEQKDEVLDSESSEEALKKFKAELADLKAQADKEKKEAVDKAKEESQREINDLKRHNEKLQKDLRDRPTKEVKPGDYDELKRQASKVTQLQNQLNARERALVDKERELKETKDQLNAVNKMNLTKREAESAEAQYNGLSHDIELMVDVQYKVKDMIAEINKLPISPKFNDDKAVTYRKGTLEVIDNALDCLNELKSKLTPDKQILYSNSDIVEVDYNE